MARVLQFVGLMTIIGGVIISGAIAFGWLSMAIDRAIYKYKIRHRFKRKPVAKCYCKDCGWHAKDYKCTLPGIERSTPDEGFCYMANPRGKE